MTTTKKLPFSIFQYSSHLEFLQDAYQYFHELDNTFSYEKITKLCDLKSRTYARNIIKGIQKASEAQLLQLGTLFGLNSEENKYLLCLFQFHYASLMSSASEIFQHLFKLQKKHLPAVAPFKEIEVATSLIHMTVLSCLSIKNFNQDPDSIASKLKNRFSSAEIASAIQDLEQHKHIYKENNSERWVLTQNFFRKYDFKANYFLKKFHQECLIAAQAALENETPNERYLIGSIFCINEKIYPRIIQKINAFIENLMMQEGVGGVVDTVVQINTQFLKVSTSNNLNNKIEPGINQAKVLDDREFEINQNL